MVAIIAIKNDSMSTTLLGVKFLSLEAIGIKIIMLKIQIYNLFL